MGPHKAFGIGIDPIIAVGRALLAVFGLVAIWLDPTQPARFQDLTYGLMSGYTAYAFLILLLVLVRPMPSEGMAWLTHFGDLTAFSAVMYLTEGPTSPFFVFFTFALLSATLRWGWRGALWTAGASLVVLGVMGFWAGVIISDTEFELNRLVLRSVYLGVAGLLLSFLGAHQEQVRGMLAGLAASPPSLARDGGWPVREALGFAAGVFGVRRTLLAWSEDEEPWQQLAIWTDGSLEQISEAPDRYDPLVAPDLEDAGFFSLDAADGDSTVVHNGGGHFRRASGLPINRDLSRRFNIGRVVSVPITAEGLSARLFLLDGHGFSADDVQVAELTAIRVAALFEQQIMLQRLSAAAATGARLHVARDIHDGVLQFLAGTGLHLKSAIALIPGDPQRATSRLTDLQEALTAEQTELRALVNALRDRGPVQVPPTNPELGPALERLASRLEQQWGIEVRWTLDPPDASVNASQTYEINQMLAEAVANASRHGGATSVEIGVHLDGGMARVSVTDNGKGFPFQGRYDLATLQAQGLGPRSLRERVATRVGQLTLETGVSGARLDIALPLAPNASSSRGGTGTGAGSSILEKT